MKITFDLSFETIRHWQITFQITWGEGRTVGEWIGLDGGGQSYWKCFTVGVVGWVVGQLSSLVESQGE